MRKKITEHPLKRLRLQLSTRRHKYGDVCTADLIDDDPTAVGAGLALLEESAASGAPTFGRPLGARPHVGVRHRN